MAMSENAVVVLNYLKQIKGADVTANDVADATGLGVRSVVPIFTSMVKKGLGERIEAEATLDDGTVKTVKLLKLTPEGMDFDPSQEG